MQTLIAKCIAVYFKWSGVSRVHSMIEAHSPNFTDMQLARTMPPIGVDTIMYYLVWSGQARVHPDFNVLGKHVSNFALDGEPIA